MKSPVGCNTPSVECTVASLEFSFFRNQEKCLYYDCQNAAIPSLGACCLIHNFCEGCGTPNSWSKMKCDRCMKKDCINCKNPHSVLSAGELCYPCEIWRDAGREDLFQKRTNKYMMEK